jgi:hypothetical protein
VLVGVVMDEQALTIVVAAIAAAPAFLTSLATVVILLSRGPRLDRIEGHVSRVEEHTDGMVAALNLRQETRDKADATARLADGDAAREIAMRVPSPPAP